MLDPMLHVIFVLAVGAESNTRSARKVVDLLDLTTDPVDGVRSSERGSNEQIWIRL